MEYKVSIDKVVDCFLTLTGNGNLDDGKVFCRTAAATVESLLDQKQDLKSHSYEICYAAAAIAFYRFTLKSNMESDTVKAGDITVNDGSEKSVAYAKALMSEALECITPLMKPKRFAFLKTEV